MDWAGPRQARWIVQHLDHEDQVLRDLLIESGSVTVAALARLGGSAEITLGDDDIDWFRDRIQIIYDPGMGLPQIPWGVFLPANPRRAHDGIRYTQTVELTTKMAVIDQERVTEDWSLPAGSNLIQAVVDLIESTGESRIAVTDSAATSTVALVFPAGESKLTIVNELLTSANYQSLWTDGTGQYRIEPYVDPGDRPVSWHFPYGEASITVPGWEREQDVLSVPNQVVVVSPGDDEIPPVIGVAENTDPESPYSIPSRGRVISRHEEVSDMSDVAAATSYARRLLQAGSNPVSTFSVRHAIVPLDPHARVQFDTDEGTRYATVRDMTMDLVFEAQCSAKWRET